MDNGNYGKITQVIGSTLDAQFAQDRMPKIYSALQLEVERTVLGETTRETLWCEVAQHLGGGQIRAIALGSTDGVKRGAKILDTGQPVTVPVGKETLGASSTSSVNRSTTEGRFRRWNDDRSTMIRRISAT